MEINNNFATKFSQYVYQNNIGENNLKIGKK